MRTTSPTGAQQSAPIIPFPTTCAEFDRRAAAAVAQLIQGDTNVGNLRRFGPHSNGIRRLVQAVEDYQRVKR